MTGLSFKNWLAGFKGEASAVGDLARDVAQDRHFPAYGRDNMQAHMYSMNAADAALAALDTAYDLYEAYVESQSDELPPGTITYQSDMGPVIFPGALPKPRPTPKA